MTDSRSLLVIRLSSLGDVLFAVPAVQALQDSGRFDSIAWLVEERAAGLLSDLVPLDELIVFPRGTPLRWPGHGLRLLARRDDLVLDLQCSMKSRLQRLFVRSRSSLGFDAPVAREGAERGLDRRVVPAPWARHRVSANLALLPSLGVTPPSPVPRPRLTVERSAVAAERRRHSQALGPGPLLVLHPGSSAFGLLKRWPAERFAAVGAALAERLDAGLLVSGTPGEEPLIAPILRALGPRARRLPHGSIGQLATQLAGADLLIAADSFPLHLANALGTPVLGLYGPKDPAINGPFFDRSRVLRSGVACSPCTLRRCSDRLCMERLTVEAVIEGALDMLGPAVR